MAKQEAKPTAKGSKKVLKGATKVGETKLMFSIR